MAEDASNALCFDPYVELPAGPRQAGLENPGLPCRELPDELILESYDMIDRKIPRTYYFDPAAIVVWGETCADSLSETKEWAEDASELEDPIVSTSTSDYFHEAALCPKGGPRGSARVRYRQVRCDYFDGRFFHGAPASNGDTPGFLGSFLWFAVNHDVRGAQLVSSAHSPSDAADSAEICTLRTTYGDFGLCDEITLEAWRVSIDEGGEVTITDLDDGRTLEGRCR